MTFSWLTVLLFCEGFEVIFCKPVRFLTFFPCPPIDSILTLMAVWNVREKIIGTAIIVSYICTL